MNGPEVALPTVPFQTISAVAVVDDAGKHRVAWLLDGRTKTAPTGPTFDKPKAVCRLIDKLNGEYRR